MAHHPHELKRSYTTNTLPSISTYYSPPLSNSTPRTFELLPPQQPSLPPTRISTHSQTNLYNTDPSTFSLPPSSLPLNTSLSSHHNTNPAMESQSTPTTPRTRPRAGHRELTPWCGTLKMEGIKGQMWGIYNPNMSLPLHHPSSSSNTPPQSHTSTSSSEEEMEDISDLENEHDVESGGEETKIPFLSRSMTSMGFGGLRSPEPMTPGTKRRWFDDGEEEGGSEGDLEGWCGNMGFNGRKIAMRKKRRGDGGKTRILSPNDFGEPFLEYGLGLGHGEVEMGGI